MRLAQDGGKRLSATVSYRAEEEQASFVPAEPIEAGHLDRFTYAFRGSSTTCCVAFTAASSSGTTVPKSRG